MRDKTACAKRKLFIFQNPGREQLFAPRLWQMKNSVSSFFALAMGSLLAL